jgi:hypothetical protein
MTCSGGYRRVLAATMDEDLCVNLGSGDTEGPVPVWGHPC